MGMGHAAVKWTTSLILFAAGVMIGAGASHASVVKKDLRSEALPKQQFLAICAERSNPRAAFVAMVEGDRVGGYVWDRLFALGQGQTLTVFQRSSVQSRISTCVRDSVVTAGALFIAEIDPDIYVSIAKAFDEFVKKARDPNAVREYLTFTTALANLSKLQVAANAKTALDLVDMISSGNPGLPQDSVESVWTPLPIKFGAVSAHNNEGGTRTTEGMGGQSGEDLIALDVQGVHAVRRTALRRLYLTIADAEDQPNVHYDIEFHIVGGILESVYVHPVEMKHDADIERGDSLCVFANPDSGVRDFVELLDRLVMLSYSYSAPVSQAFGFAPNHPFLAVPRMWQAAVTTPPACYLSATTAPFAVALVAPTTGMRYVATLVRGVPAYGYAAPVFNARVPLTVINAPTNDQNSPAQQAWVTYRSFVQQTLNTARIRASSYARLRPLDIRRRKSFMLQAIQEDDLDWNIRRYHALHEVGWLQYQGNKYRGQQDDLIKHYTDGMATVYKSAAQNNTMVQQVDVSPALHAQADQYLKLMTTAVFSQLLVSSGYDPKLTTWGTVCITSELLCNFTWDKIAPGTNDIVELSFEGHSQTKFNNTVDLGQFSLASPTNLTVEFGSDPADAKCVPGSQPPTPAHVGGLKVELDVANKGTTDATFTLAYVGSFTTAYWKDIVGTDSVYSKSLHKGNSAKLVLDFTPFDDYEDLNEVYILRNGDPVNEITLDYSFSTDKSIRVVEIDSGEVESGNDTTSGTYDIGLGLAPSPFTFRRACVWVSGDRNNCRDTQYSTCDFTQHDDSAVLAQFTLEGHHEDPGSRRHSTGHLRVAYEMISTPVGLH